MTHFVDRLPLDFSDRGLQELVGTLVENYGRDKVVLPIVQKSGVSEGAVDWDGPMTLVWPRVLSEARRTGRLRALLDVVMTSSDVAVADRVRELLADVPVVAAPAPSDDIAWKVDPSSDGEVERVLEAQSTLLDIAFLKRGTDLAASVCRLKVTLDGDDFHGTAFRIADDLLLTNHHVLFTDDGAPATKVDAWFDYELSFGGAERAYVEVSGDPASIVGDAVHDWAVVRTTGAMPASAAVVELVGAPLPEPLERVYVIQHPNGGVKKIGMVHNVVTRVTEDVVQYRVDTEGGSSGSPVFNEQWQVVALHNAWRSRTVGGRVEYYNEGRRIDRVVEGLRAAGLV